MTESRFAPVRRITRTALARSAGKRDPRDAAVGFRCGDWHAKLFGQDVLISPQLLSALLDQAGVKPLRQGQ